MLLENCAASPPDECWDVRSGYEARKHAVSNAETMPWEDRRPMPITKADLL